MGNPVSSNLPSLPTYASIKWIYTINPTKKISLQTTKSSQVNLAILGTSLGNQEFTFW